jgi:hypothetical protein
MPWLVAIMSNAARPTDKKSASGPASVAIFKYD